MTMFAAGGMGDGCATTADVQETATGRISDRTIEVISNFFTIVS
jgi:hypothetical protein